MRRPLPPATLRRLARRRALPTHAFLPRLRPAAPCRARARGDALLYATHTRLHPLQKGAVAAASALGALLRCACMRARARRGRCAAPPRSSGARAPRPPPLATRLTARVLSLRCRRPTRRRRPARADWVALVGETLGDGAVRRMAQRMRESPSGRQVLAERPRVTVRQGSWH